MVNIARQGMTIAKTAERFQASQVTVDSLPVIDFSAFSEGGSEAEKQATAQEIHDACTSLGFFYLSHHGLPGSHIPETFEWSRQFFTLPPEAKMKADSRNSDANRGYNPLPDDDGERLSTGAPDFKETFDMCREMRPGDPEWSTGFMGANQWPDPEDIPGFSDFMRNCLALRLGLMRRIMQAIAIGLDLPQDYFDAAHRYPGVTMRLLHHPPINIEERDETQWSVATHADYGSLTILAQTHDGLQVMNPAGKWLAIPPVPGAFVVNVGNLLARWTNDLFLSSVHRVANLTGESRISTPMFLMPQGNFPVECVPTCYSDTNPPR
ncbi:MAG: isopenicillin N synthase family oxygenase, partial [Alphaproteobacteria bacterium]|nr:isopenicillin N synthase family oxygenase [Alphaproteobacteria bacterium]